MYDFFGKTRHIVFVVRDQEYRNVQLLLQIAELISQSVPQLPVKSGKGLIEQQGPRLGDHCPGERRALTLSPGELLWEVPLDGFKAKRSISQTTALPIRCDLRPVRGSAGLRRVARPCRSEQNQDASDIILTRLNRLVDRNRQGLGLTRNDSLATLARGHADVF